MASMFTKHFVKTHAADGADALPDQRFGIWNELAGPGSQPAPLVVSANWTNASGGDWSTAADWSNGATPTASTNATISLAGTYTVTISTSDTASSLLIDNANVTVLDTGYLTLTRALKITAGTFELGYASNIAGGTISTGSSGAFLAEGGGMFDVAYDGTLNMGFRNAGLAMGGTIAFAGANGTGAGVINLTGVGAGINTYGVTSLDNATLNIGGAGTSNSITLYPGSVDATLTLGSNLDMVQSAADSSATIDLDFYYGHTGTLINQGTITAEAGGGTFLIIDPYEIGTFVNQGSILVSNGDTFTIAPLTWSNSGSISITGGELIATGVGYGATFTNTGSIAISNTGTLDVLNSSLTFGAGGSITTTGGGVIIDDTGGTLLGTIGVATNLDFNGGSLIGVTWQGPFSLGASQSVSVSNGLILTGSGSLGLASGAAMYLSGGLTGATALSLASGAVLDVQDTETLDNATLMLAGSGGTLESGTGGYGGPQTTLTLGSGLTVLQSGSGENYLTDGYYLYFSGGYNAAGDSITNNGTISITGGTLTANGVNSDGTFTNAGVIEVSAGELQLDSVDFSNTGSIAITGTGALDVLYTSLTFGAGGSIIMSDSGSIIDDSGGALLGTISGITNIDFAGGSLAGVTWEGPFSLGASQSVSVSNGLTLTGSGSLALASGAGMYLTGGLTGATSLSLGGGALLDVQDTETLDNGTLTLAGSGATLENGGEDGPQTTLTLGSGFTVLQSGSSQNFLTAGNYLYFSGGYNSAGDSITNNGTIAVTGGTLTVNSTDGNGTFTNTGLINVGGAGTLDMTSIGTLTNVSGSTLTGGIFEAGAGATLLLAENVSIVTDASTLILSGAGSTIESYNSTTGTYATLDTTLRSIAGKGALKLLAGRNFNASAAFTDNGLLQLGGGTFTASAGLSVASSGTLTGFGTIQANVADAGLVLASGGTLTLAGAISGAGAFGAAAGATLDLTTAETLTQSFTGAGTIKLDGGAFSLPAGAAISAGTIAVGSGASLSGYGTLTGALLDSGTVDVTGGLVIDSATNGSGTLQISSGATLDIAGGGSFAGAIYGNGGSLYIDGAAPFVLQAGASLGNEYIVVDAGATLELTQGGNLNGDIVGAGTLQLDGSTSYIFNNL